VRLGLIVFIAKLGVKHQQRESVSLVQNLLGHRGDRSGFFLA
jgi:hypothetical protein